jgi:hypothetical protein
MTFATWVFRLAGFSGLLILLPMYFFESWYGTEYPPPINHPELYYGFVGVALACQVMFVIIGSDPLRYRPMMVPAMIEKFTYGLWTAWLVVVGRTVPALAVTAAMDLTLGILFLAAFFKTSSQPVPERSS